MAWLGEDELYTRNTHPISRCLKVLNPLPIKIVFPGMVFPLQRYDGLSMLVGPHLYTQTTPRVVYEFIFFIDIHLCHMKIFYTWAGVVVA